MITILYVTGFAVGLLLFCRYAYKKNREPINLDKHEEEISK